MPASSPPILPSAAFRPRYKKITKVISSRSTEYFNSDLEAALLDGWFIDGTLQTSSAAATGKSGGWSTSNVDFTNYAILVSKHVTEEAFRKMKEQGRFE